MKTEEIVQAILLNKVKNFKWNYHQFDFKEKPKIETELKNMEVTDFEDKVISKINFRNGQFVYVEPDIEPNVVFAYFIDYLQKNPEILTDVMKRIFDRSMFVSIL